MLDMSGDGTASSPRRAWERAAQEYLVVATQPDIDAILARLHPKFVYRAYGAWLSWPLAGVMDRAEFGETLRRVLAEFEVFGSDLHELVVDGERVALHATCTARIRGAGRTVGIDAWAVLTFRHGLLAEEAVYVDAVRLGEIVPGGVIEVRPTTGREAGPGGTGQRRATASAEGAAASSRRLEGEASEAWARGRATIEHAIREFLALRAAGDVAAIRARLSPDFACNPRGNWSRTPFLPPPCGADEFVQALASAHAAFEQLGETWHEFVIDGAGGALHRSAPIRDRESGRVTRVDEWIAFRFHGSLLAELAIYVDNARLVELRA